jgi:xanthine/uracil permease
LAMGFLPILVPGIYSKFPQGVQMILGNGLAAGTLTAVLLNVIFHHLGSGRETKVEGDLSKASSNGS